VIDGGYYLKARRIQEGPVAHAPPHVREIWDWLIRNANYSDREFLERGQCLCTYRDIQEGLAWWVGWRKCTYSKWDCEKAMKWLKKEVMVTTEKTTKGMIVTVCNYELYQDPTAYEGHTIDHRKATRRPQTTDIIQKKVKKVKKVSKAYMYSENFEKFWEVYPRKLGKGKAHDSWKTHGLDDLLPEILLGVEKYEAAGRFEDEKFTPMPTTWLNQRRWEDEPEQRKKPWQA